MSALTDRLRAHGDRAAVHTESGTTSYRDLADRVDAAAAELGPHRRLVLLEARNDLASLVTHLGALAGDHVVLPVPVGRMHSALIDTYDPDVVVADGVMTHRRRGVGHELHPDLALLMSTSGSTGSPKLVRLSRANLAANASAIARYLDIRDSDCAATTLPMSYCYGLSVIHSHLLRGAALLLTERSVAEREFWELFADRRATTFAGVPYTFELLERTGFADRELPHLRYVTQAGGRLPPDRVRRFADLGARDGWQLFVMYGATEATARMAYLPPHYAASRPTAIGRPIPGGEFTLEPLDGWPSDVGELVYRGPNVMMGYAHTAADLRLGASIEALRTGDIARRGPDGLYEVIGRRSRFAKIFGLRVDLQQLETRLADHDVRALCTDDDGQLAVAAAGAHSAAHVARTTAEAAGVPVHAVRAVTVDELPMLPSGKPDYPAVRRLAGQTADPEPDATDLRRLCADVLGRDPTTVDGGATFTDLGGDSLSYVTMSVRLERALGWLPVDWHRLPLRQLEAMRRPIDRERRTRGATLETSVALRAVAIVLVVGSHTGLFELWGGAHILLGVAGYNFGRFFLTPAARLTRSRRLWKTIAWIAVPSVLWVAIAMLITDDYTPSNLLLANKILGPHDSMTAGRLWFVEVLVWTLVVLAAVCYLPLTDRIERRSPFWFAAAFLAVGLALRYDVLGIHLGREAWFTMLAFWFFAAGWVAAKATATWQRLALSLVLAVALFGYFGDLEREALVLGGLLLLIWLPSLRCPLGLTVVAGTVADASLYIYLTHYQVYPLFGDHKTVAVVAAIAAGVLLAQCVTGVRRQLAGQRTRRATQAATSCTRQGRC